MQNDMWSGKKVRLRPILTADWEKFHLNDLDSEGAGHCDVIYFPRSEEGTKAWAASQAANAPVSDNVMLAIETLEGETRWEHEHQQL